MPSRVRRRIADPSPGRLAGRGHRCVPGGVVGARTRFTVEELRYGYDDGGGDATYQPEKASPWRPVTIAPDAMLILFLTVSLPGVEMAEGSSLFWKDIGVRYKILGLSQERRVPLGFVLRVGASP